VSVERLDVGNYCYVAVCSAALGASAPTEGGEGRGHIVAAARLQFVYNVYLNGLLIYVVVIIVIISSFTSVITRATHSIARSLLWQRPSVTTCIVSKQLNLS